MQSWVIKTVGPSLVKGLLAQQNPGELGKQSAAMLDRILDDMFGYRKSEQLQTAVVPFLDKFMDSFKRELLRDGQ